MFKKIEEITVGQLVIVEGKAWTVRRTFGNATRAAMLLEREFNRRDFGTRVTSEERGCSRSYARGTLVQLA